jgi:hypothetical protein
VVLTLDRIQADMTMTAALWLAPSPTQHTDTHTHTHTHTHKTHSPLSLSHLSSTGATGWGKGLGQVAGGQWRGSSGDWQEAGCGDEGGE